MNNSFTKHPSDLGVQFVPPQDATDIRIPTAEEQSLSVEANLLAKKYTNTLKFWETPQLNLNDGFLSIAARLKSVIMAKEELKIDTVIPVSGSSEVIATEYFYVITLIAIVGGEHDPLLNQFSLQFSNSIEERENTRRYRSFSALVSSFTPLEREDAITLFAASNWQIAIADLNSFDFGSGKFYPSNDWVIGSYQLLPTLEIEPLCFVRYYNDFVERGYKWTVGSQILSSFSGFFVTPVSDCQDAIYRLMAGELLNDAYSEKAVLNLIVGATDALASPQAGQTSFSPNNSIALANDQRVSFCNEARCDRYSVQHLDTHLNTQGEIIVTATLNTNNPLGTTFSNDSERHRVYKGDLELTSTGIFTNLGSDRSLNWIAGDSSSIQLGDRLTFVPAIDFPSGSGFNVPFSTLDRVYYNGISLDTNNILRGYDEDLSEYRPPHNGEDFWVVYSPERAGLIYIYKKIEIVTSDRGTATIPETEKGVFAFIENQVGRIDAPIFTNLVPNQTYNALVYYPPRTEEVWQLEVSAPKYQGLGNAAIDLLNDGEIVSSPICFIHSQGGGNSVFQSEGKLRYAPISMFLPALNNQIRAYDMNAPVQLQNENYSGPYTILPFPLQIGTNVSLPLKGKKVNAVIRGVHEPFSLNISLFDNYGKVLGSRLPLFKNASAVYQVVIAFLVKKEFETKMLVATFNGKSGDIIRFNAVDGCAIDLFDV